MRGTSAGDGRLDWRSLGGRLAELTWVVFCAAQAFHWMRYFLLPTELNPKLLVALWGAWVLAAAVAGSLLSRAASRRFALWICALGLLPLDLFALAIAVFVLPVTSTPKRIARGIAVLLALLAIPLVLYTCNERIYGPLTEDAVLAVLQTRANEGFDYARQLLTAATGVAWACYALSLWLCLRARSESKEPQSLAGRSVLAALALLFLLAIPGTFTRMQTVRQALASGQMDLAQFGSPPAGARAGAARQDLDVVLLLGEATGREYWSLYGYPAPTTPALQALGGDLAVFPDVVSSYSHTVPSLRAMLYRDTEAQYPTTESKRVSLVDLLQAHGVAVNWYSAQEAMGPWAMPITRVARSAMVSQFLNDQAGPGGQVALGKDPDRLADAALLRGLNAPAHGSRLFVHHFMAAHSPYCAHQPAHATPSLSLRGPALFGDGTDFSADVECYARSMRMLDEQISGDIAAVRARARPTVVIFVPDHGEAPELGTGHNSQRHSARHVEVPLVVFFNDAAHASMDTDWRNLQAHKAQPFDTDWMFEMLIGLFGVDGKGLLLQPTSPIDASYTPGARILFPDSRQWNYDVREPSRSMDILSDSRLAMQAIRANGRFKGIVFAHRVDSQAKALAARDHFDGVEQDIDLDDVTGVLKVFHPPKADTGRQPGCVGGESETAPLV